VIRLLLVDDHPIVREGLRAYLAIHEDVTVVAEAASVAEAVEAASEHEPDVILLDLQLEDGHGLSAIPRLLDRDPAPRVVVLTSFLDEDYVRQAVRLGATGYLIKNAGPTAILEGIRAAVRGESPMDPAVVRALATARADPLDALTPREHEVLGLIARGMSNRAIADALVVTEKTVKTHVSAILRKLGVDDRTQAALYAKDRGL
jgi:DNA-binding NarL/FixJ family response regulator